MVVVALGGGKGSEQRGVRLGVLVSNDACNNNSNTVHIVPFTTKKKNDIPTHVYLKASHYEFLVHDSIALCEQLTLVDKSRILSIIGYLNEEDMTKINEKIKIQLQL